MKQVLIALFLCYPFWLSAQILEGHVKNEDTNAPIFGAVVSLIDKEKDVIAYYLTNSQGYFKLTFKKTTETLVLQVALLGYESKTVSVTSETQRLNVSLRTKDIQLKEFVVRAPTVWLKEDTIAYSVSALQAQNDRNIGDVLRKIPGIEVSKSGGITYQGSPINKFYIDGLDLLERKYGIATNNVPVDAVSTVEVIENHQPVTMLKNYTPSLDAAINLKLKKNKMQRPVGTIKAGLGANSDGLQWTGELFGLYAAKKNQTLVMYKTNNTGNDITSEFSDQTVSIDNITSFRPLPSSLLSTVGMNNPPLEEQRYLFNRTHVVTLNNLQKKGEYAQLRTNLNYQYDARNRVIEQESFYFIEEDSSLLIKESENWSNKMNILDGMLTYTNNAPGYYLNNKLKGLVNWTDNRSEIQSQVPVAEHFHLKNYYIQNDLDFKKKTKDRVWNLTSFVRYSALPQTLSTKTDSLELDATQRVNRSGFYTDNESYISYNKGLSSFQTNVNLEANFENLDTYLDHYLVLDSIRNDLHTDYVKTTIQPQYRFDNGLTTLTLQLPVVYHWMRISDNEYQTERELDRLYVNPSLRLRYRLKGQWDFSASLRYNQTIGDITDFITSFVMQNYRSLTTSSGVLAERSSLSPSLRIAYKDPLNGFYFNTDVSYQATRRNLIGQQQFIDKLIVSGNMKQNSSMSFWTGRGYIAKNFMNIGLLLALNAEYIQTNSERRQQNNTYSFQSNMFAITPVIKSHIRDRAVINYELRYANDRLLITSGTQGKIKTSFNQISQKLKGSFFPNKKFILKANAEYLYNEITTNTHSELLFVDVGVSYKFKRMEFTCDWNNIFNQKEYAYTSYNGLDTYHYAYKLRPQSILATVSFNY